MAGGSLAGIPPVPPGFLTSAAKMKPVDLPGNPNDVWAMGDTEKGYIIYTNSTEPFRLDITQSTGVFNVRWIDAADGRIIKEDKSLKGGRIIEMKPPQADPVI